MARPTKKEQIAIKKRNNTLVNMASKGYPMDYLCSFFGLTKGRVSQILKKR